MIGIGTVKHWNKRTSREYPDYSFKDRPEYWEDYWRCEETWFHSNFREQTVANANVKNSQRRNIKMTTVQGIETYIIHWNTGDPNHKTKSSFYL